MKLRPTGQVTQTQEEQLACCSVMSPNQNDGSPVSVVLHIEKLIEQYLHWTFNEMAFVKIVLAIG